MLDWTLTWIDHFWKASSVRLSVNTWRELGAKIVADGVHDLHIKGTGWGLGGTRIKALVGPTDVDGTLKRLTIEMALGTSITIDARSFKVPPLEGGTWERLLTIGGYHDQPRGGIATYRGRPHRFECEFSDEKDDYTDQYLLMEIDDELCGVALESQEIFHRWRSAFREGKVSVDPNQPLVLPPDRPRWDEIARAIGDRLQPSRDRGFLVRGEMRRFGPEHEDFGVRWYELSNVSPPNATTEPTEK